MTIGKVPLVPTLVVLVAVAIMVRLGFWQLDRLAEKESLIARYQTASLLAPLSAIPADAAPEDLHYRRAGFTCSTVSGWRDIAGRSATDQPGYVHIAQCPEGEVAIGWSEGPEPVEWAGGPVTGVISPGGDAGWRLVADPPQAGLEANALPDPSDLPNNHLAYAVQWFLFALTALVIYALALRKRWR